MAENKNIFARPLVASLSVVATTDREQEFGFLQVIKSQMEALLLLLEALMTSSC